MRLKFRKTKKTGFGLVEILVGSSMLVVILLSFSFFYKEVLELTTRTTALVQSNYLLDEGMEAAKLMRDSGWDTNIAAVSTSTKYHLAFSGNLWISTTTSSLIDNVYDRTITFDDVFRDINDDIATTGTYDPNARKVTIEVSWYNGATSSNSVSTYITNFLN